MKINKNLVLLGIAAAGAYFFVLPTLTRQTAAKFASAYESKVIGSDLFYFGRGRVDVPQITFANEIFYYFMVDDDFDKWYLVYIDPLTGEEIVEDIDEPMITDGLLFFLYDIKRDSFHYCWDDDFRHHRKRFDIDDFPPCHRHRERPHWSSGRRDDDIDVHQHCYNINIRVWNRTHDPECRQTIQHEQVHMTQRINQQRMQVRQLENSGRIDHGTAQHIQQTLGDKQQKIQTGQPVDTSTTTPVMGPRTRPGSTFDSSGGTMKDPGAAPQKPTVTPDINGPGGGMRGMGRMRGMRGQGGNPPMTSPDTATQLHPDTFPTPRPSDVSAVPSMPPGASVPELHHPDPRADAVGRHVSRVVIDNTDDKSDVNFDPATTHNIVKNHTLTQHAPEVQDIASKLRPDRHPDNEVKNTRDPETHAKIAGLVVSVADELGIPLDDNTDEDLRSIAMHGNPVRSMGPFSSLSLDDSLAMPPSFSSLPDVGDLLDQERKQEKAVRKQLADLEKKEKRYEDIISQEKRIRNLFSSRWG